MLIIILVIVLVKILILPIQHYILPIQHYIYLYSHFTYILPIQSLFSRLKVNKYASVSHMISLLESPILESRHNTFRTLMMYKIMNNLVDVPANTILLTLQLSGHTEILQPAKSMDISIPFFPPVTKSWNSLPQHLIIVHQIFKPSKRPCYNLHYFYSTTYLSHM